MYLLDVLGVATGVVEKPPVRDPSDVLTLVESTGDAVRDEEGTWP